MDYFGSWLPTTVGVVAAMALIQNVALAKTAREVNQIAQAITVKIGIRQENGSGILLQKNGDVYTVLTAAHVVEGEKDNQLRIITGDDQQHLVVVGSIQRYQGDVDLAVIKFRSSKKYELAELGDSNRLAGGMDLYVAGFPSATEVITESLFVFREGKVTANSKRAFKDGYGLLYSNDTLPGMSGGPVLDDTGKVVGVHGKGDREQTTRDKTGFNAGIPIARFADIAGGLGVVTGTAVARTVQNSKLTVDDYLAWAYQKYEKGNYRGALADFNQASILQPTNARTYYNRGNLKYQKLNDPRGALTDYNRTIALQPNYVFAYNNRAALRDELNDSRGALADYNRVIALNPNLANVYYNRGILKYQKLNDSQGALTDYNQAIALQPKLANAYYNRGNLKADKLNDLPGALADYNQAIILKPDYAAAHNNRGALKDELNDSQGALADYNRAITLKPDYATAYSNRGNLKYQKLNDSRGALADYNRAITLKPDYADVYNNRGLLKEEKLGDVQGAIQDLRQAARLYRQQGRTRDLPNIIDMLRYLGATD